MDYILMAILLLVVFRVVLVFIADAAEAKEHKEKDDTGWYY